MATHLIRIGALTLLFLACMFYPFMPGPYDRLAVTLSGMSQMLGYTGVLLIPIGVVWLTFRKHHYFFAIAALIAATLVAFLVAAAALVDTGASLTVAVFVFWIYIATRLIRKLPALKHAAPGHINPAPLYLVIIPLAVLLFRFTLLDPATDASRRYTIMRSDSLIRDIERYYDTNGRYPVSLLAVHRDYKPGVVGVERYQYEPNGEAYNVVFEQFTGIVGTEEFVVYNKRNEQVMTGHTMDLLQFSPDLLNRARGYYAVLPAGVSNWKMFRFD